LSELSGAVNFEGESVMQMSQMCDNCEMQDLPHSRASVGRTISSIRAEIKNRAFSGNTSSRRYRRRAAVDTPVNSDLTASAGQCTLLTCNM